MKQIQSILEKINSSRLIWIVKIATTVAVVYLVNKSLANGQLHSLLNRVSAGPVIMALLLAAAGFYLQTQRWRIVLHCLGIQIDKRTALQTMFWGSLLAFITPGKTGELLRGSSIPAARKRDTIYAVMIDKCCAGGVILATAGVCVFLAAEQSGFVAPVQWLIIIASSAIFIAAFAAFAIIQTQRQKQPAAVSLLSFFDAGSIVKIIIYSTAAHALLLIESAMLLGMFGSSHFLWNVYAVAQAYCLMIFFPFFIANMGIREYTFGLFLGYLIPGFIAVSVAAFGASMGILVLNIILPAAIGLIWWLCWGNRVKT